MLVIISCDHADVLNHRLKQGCTPEDGTEWSYAVPSSAEERQFPPQLSGIQKCGSNSEEVGAAHHASAVLI
jgi:hypothetical protein